MLVWPDGKIRCAAPVNDHVDIFERLGRERCHLPRPVDDLDQRFVHSQHVTANGASASHAPTDPLASFEAGYLWAAAGHVGAFPQLSRLSLTPTAKIAGVSSATGATFILASASGSPPDVARVHRGVVV